MSSWWIDEPTVLGSSHPTDEDLARLRSQGFSVLISLLHEEKERPNYDTKAVARAGWSRHSIPVEDFHPPSLGQVRRFVHLLDATARGAKVVVHCQGGLGRTGTMAAAYWIAKGLTARTAITRVRTARPRAVETCGQLRVLYKYSDVLRLEGLPKEGRAPNGALEL